MISPGPHNGPAPGRADLIGFVHLAAEALSTRTTFLAALHGLYHTQGWKDEEMWFVTCKDTQELGFASPITPAEPQKASEQHLQ